MCWHYLKRVIATMILRLRLLMPITVVEYPPKKPEITFLGLWLICHRIRVKRL
nr:MAG TPA: hypothetical protein [Caudoviricetes sp.]